MRHVFMLIAVLAILSGCTSANEKVLDASVGTTPAIATTGNLRLVTERRRGPMPVVCSEPSPDYAVAFDRTAKATITVNAQPGSSATVSPEMTNDENLTEGKGRQEAVLALRDGLYAACQSYANGLIGKDAYSIILSQYGNLLVALVGRASLDKDGKPLPVQVAAVSRHTSFSALVVACISGNDPTRGLQEAHNPLLTPAFCARVMETALRAAG